MGISTGTHEELRSTALEGCISCSMILKGITKLYNSLPFEHRVIYNTLNFRRVEISLPKHYPISINLYFSLPGGGFSTLLLDLFSTAGMLLSSENAFQYLTIARFLRLASRSQFT